MRSTTLCLGVSLVLAGCGTDAERPASTTQEDPGRPLTITELPDAEPRDPPPERPEAGPGLSVTELTDADLPPHLRGKVPEPEAMSFRVGDGFRFRNMTLFPLVATVDKPQEDDFITLEEGLRAGTVTARETGTPGASNGASVSRIFVENTSDKPLYLMPGETLIGGHQDRTLAEERVLPPASGLVEVAVYCVEHGRWRARGETGNGRLLESLAEWTRDMTPEQRQELLARADRGHFVATTGVLNRSVRRVVQRNRGQSTVWSEVDKVNSTNGARTETGTFIANYADEATARQVEAYETAFLNRLPEKERVLGVIVAVNGRPVASDIFGNGKLFRKIWPKLLKGYALDSIVEYDPNGPNPSCTLESVNRFLEKVKASRTGTVTTRGKVSTVMHAAIGNFESSSAIYEGQVFHKATFE